MHGEQRANGIEINLFVHYMFYIALFLLHCLFLPPKRHFCTRVNGLTCSCCLPARFLFWAAKHRWCYTPNVSRQILLLWKYGFIAPSSSVITGPGCLPHFLSHALDSQLAFHSPLNAPPLVLPQTICTYCPSSETAFHWVCTGLVPHFIQVFLSENCSLTGLSLFTFF